MGIQAPNILWEYKLISAGDELIKLYVDEVNGELRLHKLVVKEVEAPMTLKHLCLNQVTKLASDGALAFYTDLSNIEKEREIAIAQYKQTMKNKEKEYLESREVK